MQVSAFYHDRIKVSYAFPDPNTGGWLELRGDSHNAVILLHWFHPQTVEDLAQQLIEIAHQLQLEPKPCPPTN